MKLTVLGCGASPGVPRIGNDWGACDPGEPRNRRRRCSILLERFETAPDPTRVLVDTGPDVREQLVDAGVGSVDGVVYTHSHADHLHGIDDLRAIWVNTGKRVPIYADDATWKRIDAAFRYCFHPSPDGFYPATLEYRPIEIGKAFAIDGPGGAINLEAFRQVHGEIDTLGLRFGDVAYSSDLHDLPEESWRALAGLDTWIVDALRYRYHPSHFSVEDALAWIGRIGPRRGVLTHLHSDVDYRTLSNQVPDNVEVAYDGMVLEFPA